jgi:hypothetical protein
VHTSVGGRETQGRQITITRQTCRKHTYIHSDTTVTPTRKERSTEYARKHNTPYSQTDISGCRSSVRPHQDVTEHTIPLHVALHDVHGGRRHSLGKKQQSKAEMHSLRITICPARRLPYTMRCLSRKLRDKPVNAQNLDKRLRHRCVVQQAVHKQLKSLDSSGILCLRRSRSRKRRRDREGACIECDQTDDCIAEKACQAYSFSTEQPQSMQYSRVCRD